MYRFDNPSPLVIRSRIAPTRRLATSQMEEPTNLKELLPKVLQDRKIWSADAKVFAQKNANGQKNKLTLMLCWDEDDRQMNLLSQNSQKNCSMQPTRPTKKPANGRNIKCDGPCREKKSPRQVHTMGRCDHYICDLCYKINHNPDGSVGCSAFDCMRLNVYSHLNDRDAWEAYNSNIVATYNARKERFESGLFTFESHGRNASNPPSTREGQSPPNFMDSKEVTEKSLSAIVTPVQFGATSNSMKIAVRAMVFHKNNGRPDRTVVARSFPHDTELKAVIKHIVSVALGNFDGPIHAFVGTSENYALFRSLDNYIIQKTLIDFTGANGKLNLIVDAMEKLTL